MALLYFDAVQERTTYSTGRIIVRIFLVSSVALTAFAQHTPPDIEGTAKITGKILDTDGKPARGVRVLAAHLSSSAVFTSEPTGANGEYLVAKLPYGYFDLAVETPDGLYIASKVLNLRPAGEAAVIFTLMPFDGSTKRLARKHVGSDQEPTGLAEMHTKPKGREFWGSPKGVAIIASVAGAALLAIAAGSDFEPSATVF